jgi:MoaA/NifB/PqqE/SkfB family radical SAM enzyme
MRHKDKLNEIIISITNRCNLRCAMCQIPSRSADDEMSTEDIKALIRDAAVFFPSSVVFSGGEPLLRKDLFDLIAFAGRHHLNTCLTSNGTLIDDETAHRLGDSGMGVVNISIEGPREVHDALRGPENYARAVEALGHLARHKVETTIATTVCRQNAGHLLDVMKLASAAGVTTVKFQPFSPIFLSDKSRGTDFFAGREFQKDFQDVIEKVIDWAKVKKIATNPVAYLRSLPAYLCGQGAGGAPSFCAALWTSCPISAAGDVHPCWVFADKVLGNVKKNKLSQIWNSGSHNRLRKRLLEKECAGCFMSCYDANLGKQGFFESLTLKSGKLKKPKFYKRAYFRSYQYARYVSKKIIRRILGSWPPQHRKNPLESASLREEIRGARECLEKRLRALK